MIEIQINCQTQTLEINTARLRAAVETILRDECVKEGEISLAIVNDQMIHELNRRYLQHDYPTDVLSFVLEKGSNGYLEGEVIVSADTANRVCHEVGWSMDDEVLLYVIHGTLHLVGYDDRHDTDRRRMHEKEREYIERMGVARETVRSQTPSRP